MPSHKASDGVQSASQRGHPLADLCYNGFVVTASVMRRGRRGVPWEWPEGHLRWVATVVRARLWSRALKHFGDTTVRTRLHGEVAEINFGHPYPIFVQLFETYNEPLVELVRATATSAGHPAVVLDIGAGVGDTAFLLSTRCPSALSAIVAVEGNPDFLQYLNRNLARLDIPTAIVPLLVSDRSGDVPIPVRVHEGTASLTGKLGGVATTLDALWEEGALGSPDVVKIDVDGFDGRVLAGGAKFLSSVSPSVIFEWAPRFLAATGNSSGQAFQVLSECGYDRFIWYDKFGRFVHVGTHVDDTDLELLRTICLESTLPDWHYDVVALPANSNVSLLCLAALPNVPNCSGRAAKGALSRWWRS
jgi:FkbM family methyltransferase